MDTIVLKRGKEASLRRYHPWVFSGAIASCDGHPEEGDVVRVASHDGRTLGYGHCETGSIAVRVLTFRDEPIDAAFWTRRLREAFRVRQGLLLTDNPRTDIYRLVHGEGDRLPGLVVDVYGHTAVMQAHSVGMHLCREELSEALIAATGGLTGNIYYKSAATLPHNAGIDAQDGFLRGSSVENIGVENGLRFHIDWLHGQKTGFFVDQRENRSLLERYAAGRTVLNTFCYTGGFSVYALRGGARLVHSVDSSAKAIELTRENVSLNFGDNVPHEAFSEDAFHFLSQAAPGFYDLIVLDPPAFAKHQSAVHNALKGYIRLNAQAIGKIKPGGILFTFSCSQAVGKEQFRQAVFTAAAQSGRYVRILHQLHQPADHPVNIYHPEGEYLKGLVLEVE